MGLWRGFMLRLDDRMNNALHLLVLFPPLTHSPCFCYGILTSDASRKIRVTITL